MRGVLLILIFLSFLTLNAQKWALRVGFYNLKSYTENSVTYKNDQRGDLQISSNEFINYLSFGRRLYKIPQLSNFWDLSLTYSFDSTRGIMAGIRYMDAIIYSSISNNFATHTHGETVFIPVFRLNYSHVVFKSKRQNPSSLSLFAGLAINFRGADGTFSNGGWSSSTGAIDSVGNFYNEYVSAKITSGTRPKYPSPYLNIGLDGALRLSNWWKLGLEFAFYAGSNSLYKQNIKGKTNNAEFEYTLKLKPYFISGGLYIQYRIR